MELGGRRLRGRPNRTFMNVKRRGDVNVEEKEVEDRVRWRS